MFETYRSGSLVFAVASVVCIFAHLSTNAAVLYKGLRLHQIAREQEEVAKAAGCVVVCVGAPDEIKAKFWPDALHVFWPVRPRPWRLKAQHTPPHVTACHHPDFASETMSDLKLQEQQRKFLAQFKESVTATDSILLVGQVSPALLGAYRALRESLPRCPPNSAVAHAPDTWSNSLAPRAQLLPAPQKMPATATL